LTFDKIVKMQQKKLKETLAVELNRMGYKTQTKKGFIYAKGNLPVMLVAHLDTVHKKPVETICRSDDGRIVMSPEGIGGDDRAGVYMILRIIKKYRCHVLFCEDEEIGGRGAEDFAMSNIKPDINFIVELDRRGHEDAVFYDCDNPEFTKHILGFGFVEDTGSFSDISVVAPNLGIAAVNISAGYYNEHCRHEYVDMDAVDLNIERVGKLVSAQSDKFEYIESMRYRNIFGGMSYRDTYGSERYLDEYKDGKIMTLMPVPESSYIKNPNGEYIEPDGQFFIDEYARIYEYAYDLDVAVRAEGFEAVSEHGISVRFRLEDAVDVEVMSAEYALEMLEYMMLDEGEDDEEVFGLGKY
jgi:di/tripeptidase